MSQSSEQKPCDCSDPNTRGFESDAGFFLAGSEEGDIAPSFLQRDAQVQGPRRILISINVESRNHTLRTIPLRVPTELR